MRLRARYYQQFDADHSLDVPAEAYGGWKSAEVDLSSEHTALAIMHAWDTGSPETFPGWWRAVEYLPRADAILRNVFPRLLEATRRAGLRIFHVVGGGSYYRHLADYTDTVAIAGPHPDPPEAIEPDETLEALRRFRAEHVFVGRHNEADVARGAAALDFANEARPAPGEMIAENGHQLFALCRTFGVNHLVYAGFAVNWCLLLSPGGMAEMARHGILCSVLADATTAVENRETARRQLAKEIALWRVALAFGFVFETSDFIKALGEEDPAAACE